MMNIRRYIPIPPYVYAFFSLLIVFITIGIHTAFAFSENNEAEKLKLRTENSRVSILKDIEKSIIENNSIIYNHYHTKW